MKTSDYAPPSVRGISPRALADLIFPRICVVCEEILDSDEDVVCRRCLEDFPFTRYENLARNPMGDRLNAGIDSGPYVTATALFFYRCAYQRITPSLKYGRNFAAGARFGRMLGERLASSSLFNDIDFIIPVPLHPLRHFRRGYNQAGIIAESIRREMPGATIASGVLKRTRATRTQTRIRGEEKKENVKGAFAIRGKEFEKLMERSPKHILVTDDVLTSGNTLAACCNCLRTALPGEVRISVATLAFVYD